MIPNEHIIAVMDGDCALCCRGARWIAANDSKDHVRIATLGLKTASDLMVYHGLDPHDPDTWLVVDGEKPFVALEATLHLAKVFGGWIRILLVLLVVPKSLRDWFYHLVARNRYTWFGRSKMCDLPDPKLRAKLLTQD